MPTVGEIAYGLGTAVLGATVSILGYRKSQKNDAIAAQAGVSSETRAGTEQVIEGMNKLVDQQQEDIATLRARLGEQAEYYTKQLDEIEKKCGLMKAELDRFRQKYGNGAREEVKPPPNDAPG